MPLGEDAARLGEHVTQAAERLIRLHMIMGLPEKALPILLSLVEADSVTSILDSLIERVHVAAGTGKFDSIDAGRVVPSLRSILQSFMDEAQQYDQWVLSHYRSPLWITVWRRIVQVVSRRPAPDILDLWFKTSGLMEAALWVLTEVSALQREIHLLQFPIGLTSRHSPAGMGMPISTWEDLLDEFECASALEVSPTASREDLLIGAQWLADRVRIVTQQNLGTVNAATVQVAGLQLASAPSVLSALREVALIAAFTIWFGGRIQSQASRLGGRQAVVTNVVQGEHSRAERAQAPWHTPEALPNCDADVDGS